MDRVTLRESIGRAVSHGLAPGTADRIGAFARAGKLGILLWEWGYANINRELEAGNLLTRRAAKRLRMRCVGEEGKREYETLRRACTQVLREWRWPECQVCLGVKELSEVHKRVVCPKCNGSGWRRYEDDERAKALKIEVPEYRKTWDRHFATIRTMIIWKDSETAAVVREQLKGDTRTVEVEGEVEEAQA